MSIAMLVMLVVVFGVISAKIPDAMITLTKPIDRKGWRGCRWCCCRGAEAHERVRDTCGQH